MSFEKLIIKNEYRTSNDNIVRDFYVPVLAEAISYKRAVGFFSSSALVKIAAGLESITKKEGKIELIVSPRLSEEDIDEINIGYERRKEIIAQRIIDSFSDPSNPYERKKMGFLSLLIEQGYLDIKVAFMKKNSQIGMFHEKLGILEDEEGNIIAFSGSLNESLTAYTLNFESIDVYCDWKSEESCERAHSKLLSFSKMWSNNESEIEIIDFPKVIIEKLEKIKKDYDTESLCKLKISEDSEYISEDGADYLGGDTGLVQLTEPKIPKSIKLHKYQEEAIESWKLHNYSGIFDMATGTGKTYTGISALVNLFEEKRKLFVVIICPYVHLVDQWKEDLIKFHINPITGYSSGSKNYLSRLVTDIEDYNLDIINFTCFITTNASFRSEKVQKAINKVEGSALIIVDEAHNFGAPKLVTTLPNHFEYRLALSATLERHNDAEGTELLYEYFGEKCIEYDMERAILEDKLSPYKYYPLITYFDQDELEKYIALSVEAAKHIKEDKKGKFGLDEIGKMILLKRARIVAAAKMKAPVLISKMRSYSKETGILIYCGATNMIDDDINDDEIRQIDLISKKLYSELGFRSSQFTSNEDRETREKIKQEFIEGKIQGIVAIKCLDEGVNIPSIKTAFILASSTNPKEYIQRRGRVLRKSGNKSFAEIYDFVVLPRRLEEALFKVKDEIRFDSSLVKRELKRIKEFGRLSMNPSTTGIAINEIENAYFDLLRDDETEIKNEMEDII